MWHRRPGGRSGKLGPTRGLWLLQISSSSSIGRIPPRFASRLPIQFLPLYLPYLALEKDPPCPKHPACGFSFSSWLLPLGPDSRSRLTISSPSILPSSN